MTSLQSNIVVDRTLWFSCLGDEFLSILGGKTGKLSGSSVCLPSYLFSSLACLILYPRSWPLWKTSPGLFSADLYLVLDYEGIHRREEAGGKRDRVHFAHSSSVLGSGSGSVFSLLQLLISRPSSVALGHRALGYSLSLLFGLEMIWVSCHCYYSQLDGSSPQIGNWDASTGWFS